MKNSIRSIKEAGLGGRMVAMVMDAVVFVFVFFALALFAFTPIANNAMHYNDLELQGTKWEVFSKLYVVEETLEDKTTKIVPFNELSTTTGKLKYIPLYEYTVEDIEFFKDRLHYYYCSYKTGENLEVIEGKDVNDFRSPEYNILIKDNKGEEVLPKLIYTDEWFNSLIDGKTTVKDFRNLSYSAVKELRESKYFTDLNKQITYCQAVIILPAFGISYLGFYLVVPLIFKNGETFGKKVMHIGFVSKDGYNVKKRQIVFRQILILIWLLFSAFVVGIGLTSVATMFVGIFLYLLATVISRTKRSPMDYAAYTYLIDTQKSVWFKDANEEEKKEQELEEKMSKYQKYEPDQSHLIQVGTEIVDEDVKKEIEKEKVKKVKK